MTKRLMFILQSEKIVPEEEKIREFLQEHHRLGLREIINLFQCNYNANSGSINYSSLKASAQFDENLVKLILDIIEHVMTMNDSKTRKLCATRPINTPIADQYSQFVALVLNNAFDINYDFVLQRMYETIQHLPLRHIIGRYSQTLEGKKYPQYHLESCLKELLDCCAEAML